MANSLDPSFKYFRSPLAFSTRSRVFFLASSGSYLALSSYASLTLALYYSILALMASILSLYSFFSRSSFYSSVSGTSSSSLRRSSSSALALAAASSSSISFFVFFFPLSFFFEGETTTGGFGGSGGVSSFSNFFSSWACSFLKLAISRLKKSSLSERSYLMPLYAFEWIASKSGAISQFVLKIAVWLYPYCTFMKDILDLNYNLTS